MKKVMKLCKIFLVLVTIFSQLSSVITVLADEITEKPLSIILEQVMNDDGSVKEYKFSYKSSKGDYEDCLERILDTLENNNYTIVDEISGENYETDTGYWVVPINIQFIKED